MPNSTAQISVLLQILDGLGITPTPLVNHQMPPVAYAGSSQTGATQNTYSGYLTVNPGGAVTLFNNPPISPFLLVRNAGTQGVVSLSVTSEASFSVTGIYQLTPGGIFIHANNTLVNTTSVNNYLLFASIGVVGSVPAIVEYCFGV